ncbi:MAG: 1,4-dihydroxy-2-naphthoate octaprenyltransferase [Bdellovibrionales bacterium]|nr:1,4-dihydroxy-2-naphthoate octaprenyltransferase [Bdellovibrionales bacterium]
MKPLFLAIRWKTLSASFAPIMVATALVSLTQNKVLWWVSGLCLAGSLFIQIATNLLNDVIDFRKGADTSERVGPQRVTASGVMSEKKVFAYAILMLILAMLCGVPLVLLGGTPVLIIGLVSLFMAYSYTGGPFPLAYLGLGDLFVILFFGLIAVMGTYYLHTGLLFQIDAFIAGLQVGFLSTILIAINNFRDIEQDKKANKKTLAVRFGSKFARYEILFLMASTFLLNGYWFYRGWYVAAALPLILLSTAYLLLRDIFIENPSEKFNGFLARSAKLQMLFCFQLTLGLALEHLV